MTFIVDDILSEGGITGTTISGGTLYGDGSNLTGVSGGGSFTGGTVTGATNFTNGLTADTFSSTTITTLGLTVPDNLSTSGRRLYDSSAVVSVDWDSKMLGDSTGTSSIDWANRLMTDSTAVTSLDWENYKLFDTTNGSESIVWRNRILSNSSNNTILNWENGILSGMTNIQSSTISAATYLNLTTGNLPSVQARRTTGFSLPPSVNFITLDTTDVENDSTVVSHDNVNTERIYVYSTGLYLIHYHGDVGPGTVTDFEFSVYKNALTVVNGSLIAGKNSSTDKVTAGVNIVVSLNSGDYVSLYGRYIGSSGGIANNVVFSVIKLEGVVGPQGPTGAQGPQGIGLFTGGTINADTIFTAGLSATTLNFTTTPTNNNANTEILTRNSTTGDVEYRDSSSLGGGSIDTGKVIALTQIMYF